ncbi:glycosyltransferase [Rhodoblastus acidophilus]|uniref:Glycosyltransferase n=1 Tax=Rhodoblastus acidophilus TaxID=1074 RepID=A0A6N8DMR8_RHOAC|nr:glycosyltransferase [Rhodoblastus acidophilus]MCW2274271.1 glycosyltransferase involved in cell wall biosynthesis [Rhodoblastus acidophilus]MTV30835.1 glycosyltransferase [Rhodoblastus acidophilus]
MQDRALVSVVIPSFNHVKYVGRAIDSVLDQTYPHFEIVVIDDGSRDGSYEFIMERYGHDPRVKASHRENRGAHETLNEAIAASTGAFISILNSDDVYAPNRLAAFVEAAGEAPFFGISALNLVDENGVSFAPGSGYTEYYDMVCRLSAGKPDVYGLWCGNIAITTSNFFFSRSVYDAIGPFRALRYAHDWDWALRASARFNLRRITEKLLSYRIHGSNTILETDRWAHVVENAFVCASALRRDKVDLRDASAGAQLFGGLQVNWAFPLLPTLYLLADTRGEAEQLALLATGALLEETRLLPQGAETDPLLWESAPGALRGLRDLRAARAQAERDRAAAGGELAAIKKSLAWKLVGWLWRLETRRARKAAKAG